MAEGSLTLGYWATQGAAQPTRLLLEYYQVPYTEKLYADRDEWFNKDKNTLETPFPNLPYIKDGDFVLTESSAVIYYAATKTGNPDLVGKTPLDKVHLTQVFGVLGDLRAKVMGLLFNKDYENVKKDQIQNNIVPYLDKLNKKLGDQEYFLGYLTVVDFIAYFLFEIIQKIEPTLFESYPAFKKHYNRIHEHENIKKYHESDRYKNLSLFPPGLIAAKLE